MCSAPEVKEPVNIVSADDATVRRERDRRIRLGQQTGGVLATQVSRPQTDNRVKLG